MVTLEVLIEGPAAANSVYTIDGSTSEEQTEETMALFSTPPTFYGRVTSWVKTQNLQSVKPLADILWIQMLLRLPEECISYTACFHLQYPYLQAYHFTFPCQCPSSSDVRHECLLPKIS